MQPLSLSQKLLYGSGHFGISLLAYFIVQWLQDFYFPASEGRPALVAYSLVILALSIGRFTDAVNDPLIGYWSDRITTRWGRRKPFMLVALLPLVLTFVLLWHPPAQTLAQTNFWWLVAVLAVYLFAFTAYVAPYLALLSELTATSKERTNLATLQGFFNLSGIVVGGAAAELLLSNYGYQGTAWMVAAIAFVSLALPIIGPSERVKRADAHPQPPPFRSIRMILQNRPFLCYIASKVVFLGGMMTLIAALPYLVEHRLGLPSSKAGIMTAVAVLCGMAAMPVVTALVRRRGLKFAYISSILWFAVTLPLLATFGVWHDPVIDLWYARGVTALCGLALGGLFALPYAILSNITDYDRSRTGISRQGIFFGVQGLIMKAAYAGGPALALFIIFFGTGTTTEPSALGLILIGPITAIAVLIGALIFRAYPEAEVEAAVRESHAQAASEG
ncbi:MAG: MFS transporter [Armatimonadetes bacterium]|nr:MFS transporter [Armatimonadota bacterium]